MSLPGETKGGTGLGRHAGPSSGHVNPEYPSANLSPLRVLLAAPLRRFLCLWYYALQSSLKRVVQPQDEAWSLLLKQAGHL